MRITAVIPTYNRAAEVTESVRALITASRPPDDVVVVDNASTDDTLERLHADWGAHPDVHVLASAANVGAAAGFARGIRWARAQGADAAWLVDDDARAAPDALERLIELLGDDDRCLASVMVSADRERLCWGAITREGSGWRRSWTVDELGSAPAEALYVPYTGLLVPMTAVARAGLPRADFFMWADDVEYSFRLGDVGWPITYVPQSHIVHPVQARARWRVLGREVTVLEAPPWKRYYAVRNEVRMNLERGDLRRLARQLGAAVVAATREPRPLHAWPLYARGLMDGLLGRMGARVRPRR